MKGKKKGQLKDFSKNNNNDGFNKKNNRIHNSNNYNSSWPGNNNNDNNNSSDNTNTLNLKYYLLTNSDLFINFIPIISPKKIKK